MNKHTKKMIAPIIITILFVLYFTGILVAIFNFNLPLLPAVIAIVVPAALAGVMIYVCVQRIREIRSGEEDDLSKY